jgi:hypothetical protein
MAAAISILRKAVGAGRNTRRRGDWKGMANPRTDDLNHDLNHDLNRSAAIQSAGDTGTWVGCATGVARIVPDAHVAFAPLSQLGYK